MARFNSYTAADIQGLGGRLDRSLRKCTSIQPAAQACTRTLFEEFRGSLALARFYLTFPFGALPPAERDFAARIANANKGAGTLNDRTFTLNLLGTSGEEDSWNDRTQSQGHLAIPLLSSRFVAGVPMVSRLMSDMSLGLEWIDQQDTSIVVKKLGKLARAFYVEDAGTTLDESARHIVPAEAFVHQHNIKTVFGLGGCYVNGPFVAIILFTTETITRERVEGFMSLMQPIKLATTSFVMSLPNTLGNG